jgi:hypothetical protein
MAYLPCFPAQSLIDPTRLSQGQVHKTKSQIITYVLSILLDTYNCAVLNSTEIT